MRITGLRFQNERLVILMEDGPELSVPLGRYPTLMNAPPADRDRWEMIGPGKGFHWRSLDLDLSIEGLLQGLPEAIPRPPALRAGPTGRPAG